MLTGHGNHPTLRYLRHLQWRRQCIRRSLLKWSS
ncbi:hypothetical protein CY0110_18327 [Crocosphaera chwakensis CCY0110]|uniref:Uncharacterized protein n=1 Tax=Crocosphaera chwakensis CCY0110 TaxID=391612 RepID=A3IIZ7_9CHRO|nr:hypothetical protein CY0110_18327 [Crocosphaera chwakensis CCY0110]